MTFRAIASLSLFVAAVAAPSAFSAGMYLPGIGSPALGSGGAFVASGIDPTAIWHNPANLADLAAGEHFAVDAAFIHSPCTFWRAEDSGLVEFPNEGPEFSYDYPVAENRAGVFTVPGFFAVHATGSAALALGVWGPYQGRFTYDEDGPTRYNLIRNTSYTAYVGLAGAAKAGSLRIGGGVQCVPQGVNAEFKVMTLPAEIGDAYVRALSDNISWTWNVGLTWVPRDDFRLGGSYQRHVSVDGEMELNVDLPQLFNYAGVAINGDQADYTLQLADILRLGAARRIGERTWVELEGVLELWSNSDSLVVTPDNILVEGLDDTLGVTSIRYEFDDAVSLRLGVRHDPAPRHRFGWSLGALYESQAVPTRNYTVGSMSERYGVSGGLHYVLGDGWGVKLSLAHYLQSDVTVDESDNNPSYVGLGDITPAVQSRGRYESANTIVAVGLRYTL
jgi:long-subunit fatty acid transport protein